MSTPAEQLITEQAVGETISLNEFVTQFGDELLQAVSVQNPPIFDGRCCDKRKAVMEGLLRRPFDQQQYVVQALSCYLFDHGYRDAVINAEMGTGKTMMAIALAAVAHQEGYRRTLILSPPHLVYKWRREILETVPDARVWVLNGPDTIARLLQLRDALHVVDDRPEFYVLGRVRMRMGFNWEPSFVTRRVYQRVQVEQGNERSGTVLQTFPVVSCPDCGTLQKDSDGDFLSPELFPQERQCQCSNCRSPLWTLVPSKKGIKSKRELLSEAMCKIPTIGPKTASVLIESFGEEVIEDVLTDNVYEFVNLMDGKGEFVFNDRQAKRIERALANLEFGFGQGGYQPSEFIKRYLPNNYFDLLIPDEGHEYKNDGSAQGQAMGVVASKTRKIVLLTGTLMGGYASDLFFLLWRMNPASMVEDGYTSTRHGSLGPASMAFMRDHGILKDIHRETDTKSFSASRGKRFSVRTTKAPGFGPMGIVRYVLPRTVFLKLRDLDAGVLPTYEERYEDVCMTTAQGEEYRALSLVLTQALKEGLRKGDTSLMGVVLNTLLAWPDCCFRPEVVKHPRTRHLIKRIEAIFDGDTPTPKETRLIDICLEQKTLGRRVLVYTTYTGKRDTASRLKQLLEFRGFKTAVLRSSVETGRREDWIIDQVERGIDVLICNPELVKTGLDLLEFPTIVFMQTGYNVYTIMQAARRSWRIGQLLAVLVYFLGYRDTAQIACLSLMARKIAVTQSTSGDMPDCGLAILDQDGDSVEVALAKQLVA